MPEGIEAEAMAAIHFAEGFVQRYGPCHPMFFPGSLDDAMREACHQPAHDVRTGTSHYFLNILIFCLIIFKQGKLLAVYLHHDGSVSSNVFCTQVRSFV